jgi:hypothetical protein
MPQNLTPKEIACRIAIQAIPLITREEADWFPKGLAKALSRTNDKIAVVEQLLPKKNPIGFAELQVRGRLDLTVEVFVLDKRWSEWFTADIKKIAVERLSEAGYDEPEPKYLWNRKTKKSPASP